MTARLFIQDTPEGYALVDASTIDGRVATWQWGHAATLATALRMIREEGRTGDLTPESAARIRGWIQEGRE